MLLYGDGVVSTCSVAVVVCNDHALPSINHSNTCNDVSGGDRLLWLERIIASKLGQLKEWGPVIKECIDPVSRKELVSLQCLLAVLSIHMHGDSLCNLVQTFVLLQHHLVVI